MKRKLSIILVMFILTSMLMSCNYGNVSKLIGITDVSETEADESQVFWIKNPRENLETQMNIIIEQVFDNIDIDAKQKGYLIKNYKVTDCEWGGGAVITAQYGPNKTVSLTATLNEKDELTSIFTFCLNSGDNITTEELVGVYTLLALTSGLHDMKYTNMTELSDLLKDILRQNPEGTPNADDTGSDAILTEGDCEYKISMSEFMFGFQIRDLSKCSDGETENNGNTSGEQKTESDVSTSGEQKTESGGTSSEEKTKSDVTPTSETIAAAKEMFEMFLGSQDEVTYDDDATDGSIIVCRETPEEYNNYASYSICGRGFSPIYDTDCIGADEYSWIFKSGGYYYLICSGMDGFYVYYNSSLENLAQSSEQLCGSFSTAVYEGENDITVANFEQKVSLSPGNSAFGDFVLESYRKEIHDSDNPLNFSYEYLGDCSEGFYYYNGESNTFSVYRIFYEDGYETIYFIPLNIEDKMIYEFYEYYYELMYRWTQY